MWIYIQTGTIPNILFNTVSDADFSLCASKIYRIPSKSDCGSYYNCFDKTKNKCPIGLVFDKKLQACDFAQNVPGCEGYRQLPEGGKSTKIL